MFVSTIPVICYYNGNLLRTKTDVKYVENKAVIMSRQLGSSTRY